MFQTLGVDDIALDLSRLLEISKHDLDNVGEAKDNITFSGLGQFSPMFVQLMTVIFPYRNPFFRGCNQLLYDICDWLLTSSLSGH